MKIALILGRGIEGAGVTRFATELNNYINENNMYSHIFAVNEKSWPRKNLQNIINYSLIEVDQFKELSIKLNTEFDLILYCSIPAKKGFSQKCIDDFYNYLICDVIKPKKFSTQNDHKKQSLARNANLYEINEKMDGIFSFSNKSPFFEELKIRYGKNILNKYIFLQNGINFKELLKYRKDIKDREKRVTYLGRYATFKDPFRLYNFHSYIKRYNFKSELIGIERSIGAVFPMFKFSDMKTSKHNIEMFDCTDSKKFYTIRSKQDIQLPYVYGPYEREKTLNEIGDSLFGCSFYNINSDANGNNIEYAQLEMISVGLIPLFDYDWSLHTKINNISLNTIINFGIFLKKDLSNAEECAFNMNEIFLNLELRKKYYDTSFESIQVYSSDVVFKKMIDTMQNFKQLSYSIPFKKRTLF
ncbi:MAG: hypothetical protein PHF86_12160 [Candidatus Nanoarchaeia archaeon]|jgi:hypothetical protein|nr:hypothetical protein [Candidatus Nanoarchaeia archaeon]